MRCVDCERVGDVVRRTYPDVIIHLPPKSSRVERGDPSAVLPGLLHFVRNDTDTLMSICA